MLKRPILLGAAFAALLSSSASAQQTVTLSKPCYVSTSSQSELVGIVARGFTPTAFADVYVDETFADSPQVGYDGSATGSVKAPLLGSGQRPFSVRVTEKSNPSISATATAMVTAFSVEQLPAKTQTDRPVRFRGRGFMDPGRVYAHYLFAGRPRKTRPMGFPKGPCGTFNHRQARQFPFKRKPDRGTWTIQFDQVPDYRPDTATKVTMSVTVTRKPKSQAR